MAQKLLTPIAVHQAQRRIRERIRAARLARNLPMQLVAERAMTTRQTVGRIEAGDPRVAFGTVLAVLNALGLLDTVSGVAGAENDPVMHAQQSAALAPRSPSRRGETQTVVARQAMTARIEVFLDWAGACVP